MQFSLSETSFSVLLLKKYLEFSAEIENLLDDCHSTRLRQTPEMCFQLET